MAALVSAWTLLKNRGQELDLPPPTMPFGKPNETLAEQIAAGRRASPQDLTDRRVDANSKQQNLALEHELSLRDLAGPNPHNRPFAGKLSNAPYDPYFGSDQYRQRLEGGMSDAKLQEEEYENAQRQLDQQTMTREGQQGEADEMDAMGVPDMGRSVGGRAPPNVGRAGNSQMTFPSHSLTGEETNEDLANLKPPNPFPLPFNAGEFNFDKDIEQAMQRRSHQQALQAAMESQPDYSDAEEDDDMDASLAPFVGERPKGLGKSFDAAWKLLKGDYDQDMQQLQMLDGQQTAQAVTQNPPPAAYENNPEGWAEDYMSQMADYQGALSANVGDPNFPLSQLAGMKTQAGEKMDATMEDHSQREKRLAELKAMGEQMRFEGRPPL